MSEQPAQHDDLPMPKEGFLRIAVALPRGTTFTPGALATAVGIGLEHIGPVQVRETEAAVDVRIPHARQARAHLERIGATRVIDWQWRWLRLHIGRNHGLSIGQLRKVLAACDPGPLGKINLNNTHSLIGIQDWRLHGVIEHLAHAKVNGYPVRPDAPPPGEIAGSPAFGHPR